MNHASYSDTELALFGDAKLGIQAEEFLNSSVGKALVEKAQGEQRKALKALAEIDPTQTEEIRNLQNAAKIPSLAVHWVLEQVARGAQAEHNIHQMEQNDGQN